MVHADRDPTGSQATELVAEYSRVPEASAKVRIVNLCAVVIPFLGLVAAIAMLWGIAFDWVHLVVMGTMYLLTAVGITVGFHRLFTHRSFKAPRPVQAVLAVLGSMAVEGPLLHWVANHRGHHQHSDHSDDPHTPHGHGERLIDQAKGMFHAHVGWIIRPRQQDMSKYTKDLVRDRMLVVISRLFPLWVVIGLGIPALVAGLATMSWVGAALGFVWGGLVRVLLVHHVTWSINSVCHLWGSRPFRSHDHSRNNVVFGVLALGEGWHNNHHAFPTSARHGLRWWQLDISYLIILAMARVGLASEVRIPTPERIRAKQAA